jgi:hypothetical protein
MNDTTNTIDQVQTVGTIKSGDFVTEIQLIDDGWKSVSRVGKHQIWKRGKRKLNWNKDFGQCTFIN